MGHLPEEAGAGLSLWLELALAGVQIQIRQGDALVELRPAPQPTSAQDQAVARVALQRPQQNSGLSPQQAESCLRDMREERQAAGDRLPR